jgi:hypothetical protein
MHLAGGGPYLPSIGGHEVPLIRELGGFVDIRPQKERDARLYDDLGRITYEALEAGITIGGTDFQASTVNKDRPIILEDYMHYRIWLKADGQSDRAKAAAGFGILGFMAAGNQDLSLELKKDRSDGGTTSFSSQVDMADRLARNPGVVSAPFSKKHDLVMAQGTEPAETLALTIQEISRVTGGMEEDSERLLSDGLYLPTGALQAVEEVLTSHNDHLDSPYALGRKVLQLAV